MGRNWGFQTCEHEQKGSFACFWVFAFRVADVTVKEFGVWFGIGFWKNGPKRAGHGSLTSVLGSKEERRLLHHLQGLAAGDVFLPGSGMALSLIAPKT